MDDDSDGIINEEQFKALVLAMNVVVQTNPQADLDALLKVVDPNNNKTMTYS